jgi:hypothetical protein
MDQEKLPRGVPEKTLLMNEFNDNSIFLSSDEDLGDSSNDSSASDSDFRRRSYERASRKTGGRDLGYQSFINQENRGDDSSNSREGEASRFSLLKDYTFYVIFLMGIFGLT